MNFVFLPFSNVYINLDEIREVSVKTDKIYVYFRACEECSAFVGDDCKIFMKAFLEYSQVR